MEHSSLMYPKALNFKLSADEITQLTEKIVDQSKALLDLVAASVSDPSWANTMKPLIDEDSQFSVLSSNCCFPSQVSADKAIRDASTDASKRLSAYSIEKTQRLDVFKAFKSYVNDVLVREELNEEQRYLIKRLQFNFEHSGLSLPEEKLARLKLLKQEESDLSIQFSRNILEDKTTLEYTLDELEGLPESCIQNFDKTSDGLRYLVTLQYPDMFPILKRAKKSNTRKRMNIAKTSQCMALNLPLFERIIALRQEQAAILGYSSHAHATLVDRMAKYPEVVFDFLNNLNDLLQVGLETELAKLLEMKKVECESSGEPFDGKIQPWDWSYYINLHLLRDYHVDEELISHYFPLGHVIQAIFRIYETLFGISFTLVEHQDVNQSIWHPDVKLYHVHDSVSKVFIGYVYLDLHPREGKYNHAAAFPLQKGCVWNDQYQHPAGAMVANFPKPTLKEPSLMKHDDVVTFAHELGHVLHEILSCATYSYFSGLSVQPDFVEMPSQALENWCYEKEAVTLMSHHVETGEPLPDQLIDNLVRSRYANVAMHFRRQLFFAKFDMIVHSKMSNRCKAILEKNTLDVGSIEEAEPLDLDKLWHDLSQEIMMVKPAEGTNGLASFQHLVGGYDSGYYGYLWSQVISVDVFERIKQNGILNPTIGRIYRDTVLAPGGSKDAMDILKNFLGREPNSNAFFKQIGLSPESQKS